MKKRNLYKKAAVMSLVAVMTAGSVNTVFAGQWAYNSQGWWYSTKPDGTDWYKNEWQWIDGNGDGTAECYYFNADGYTLVNTTTPDGYTVNADGAWVKNGVVQTKNGYAVNTNDVWNENDAVKTQDNRITVPNGTWLKGVNTDADKWWFRYADGSYPENKWVWLDGNNDEIAERYYFDANGWCVVNGTTPDGFSVNADGAWTENGVVQTKAAYVTKSNVSQTETTDSSNTSSSSNKTSSKSTKNTYTTTNEDDTDDESYESSDNSSEKDYSNFASECFDLINKERTKNGLAALEWNDTIAEACEVRAQEISEKFSHVRPDGTICFTIYDEFGLDCDAEGENIAEGQKTPEKVVYAWMHSTGHKENILKKRYTDSAIGFYYDTAKKQFYWVQMFCHER